MHAAKLAKSARLQRVLDVLRAGGEHSTRELVMAAQVCAVNSIIAELRANGFAIDCRQKPGERTWLYRLSREPSSAETPAPAQAAGSAGCPLPARPDSGASADDGWRLTPPEDS